MVVFRYVQVAFQVCLGRLSVCSGRLSVCLGRPLMSIPTINKGFQKRQNSLKLIKRQQQRAREY